MKKCSIVILLFLLFVNQTIAQQTKNQLEKEKKENLDKIKNTSKILNETQSKKKATIGQLAAINQKVKDQEKLISTIQKEINYYDNDIEENKELISALQADLDTLKKEYASMIYAASKTQNGYNKLLFVFSSKSLTELIMRMKYMEHYAEARNTQLEQIQKVQIVLEEQNASLEKKKLEKRDLLDQILVENQNLVALKNQQNSLYNELSSKEKELRKELAEKEKAIAKLDKLIEDIVRAELAKSKEKGFDKMKLTPEAVILSNSFAENKGRLLWPVEYGFISHKFGKQPHPVIKGVVVDNLGVDIQTKKGASVRSVFDGQVTAVAEVPGMNKVVMIQHGEYFTVYAKVTSVNVKMGQKVKAKDIIATAVTNNDDITELQFQVWKVSQKENPEYWLYKR